MTSRQEIEVYRIVKASPRWLSNNEIAARIGVHDRTARRHTVKFAKAGVFAETRLGDGHLFRFKCPDPEIERIIADGAAL